MYHKTENVVLEGGVHVVAFNYSNYWVVGLDRADASWDCCLPHLTQDLQFCPAIVLQLHNHSTIAAMYASFLLTTTGNCLLAQTPSPGCTKNCSFWERLVA
jgi:hypothetical protein